MGTSLSPILINHNNKTGGLGSPLYAMKKKPKLSPTKALQNELRTLDRAEAKIIGDCVKDEVRTERQFNKWLDSLTRQTAALKKSWTRTTETRDLAVTRQLNIITVRRNRLRARLAAQ